MYLLSSKEDQEILQTSYQYYKYIILQYLLQYFLSLLLILIRPFIEFFNLRGNSVYVLPDNGLKIEIFTDSLFADSVTQPDPSLIQLSILCKIS